MNKATQLVTASLLGLVPLLCCAQYRDNQQPVMSPPPPRVQGPADVLGPFWAAYQAAGEPRILLFWNVSFDDSTETTRQHDDLTKRTTSDSSNSLDKTTAGEAGNATLRESDSSKKETSERVTGDRIVDTAKQKSSLTARNGVELEFALRQQLKAGGVHLLERAASIRFTQAERDRAGVDPKLIEADAVLGKADLLLEIVMVPDKGAPLGAGFRVTVTDVHSGLEVLSLYTLSIPQVPQLPSHYVATSSGFEKVQLRVEATVGDVGVELGREILSALGPQLTTGPRKAR